METKFTHQLLVVVFMALGKMTWSVIFAGGRYRSLYQPFWGYFLCCAHLFCFKEWAVDNLNKLIAFDII
ncbi:hypothetical protein KHA80_22885 [Anaerobacillus sp. HL2]|nr:hypothetical protein KHA80_22885 [Anaerobacillus sp. HL2]